MTNDITSKVLFISILIDIITHKVFDSILQKKTVRTLCGFSL